MKIKKQFKNKYFETFAYCRFGSSDEKSFLEVITRNNYERFGLKISPEDRWLDLGANAGAFALYCAERKINCISFEPEESNVSIFKKNLLERYPHILLQELAVVPNSEKANKVKFIKNLDPARHWRNSCVLKPKRKPFVEIEVPALQFEKLRMFGGNALKIDIEGSEIDIFAEKPDLSSYKKMVLEWSFDYKPEINRIEAAIDHIKKYFDHVYCDKRWTKNQQVWAHFPMNAMIYCYNDAQET